MIEKIKKHKWSIVFLALLYIILVYCHFQTFIINDDLPYSLYFRVDDRVTDIIGIIKNQVFDYSHISPRVFIHFVVQFLLMFEKNLWSILNPLVIVGIVALMSYILYEVTKKKVKFIYIIFFSTLMFLLLYNYKYLIYWVAGSVNYVWVFLLYLLVVLYYFKIGFLKKPVITFLISLVFSCLCEATSILMIILLVFDLFRQLYFEREDKKIIIKYVFYLIGAFSGFAFLMLAPSNLGRMNGSNSWSSLNLFEKLCQSLPVISENVFSLFDVYNLFPWILSISIIYYLKANKNIKWFILLGILFAILSFVSAWFWLAFGVLLLFYQGYIFVKNKDLKMIGMLLGGYAVTYSLAITPEYEACRTAFHLSLIMGMFSIYNFIYDNGMSNIVKIITVLLLISTIIFEIIIYSYIGFVKTEREKSLEKVLSGESKVLETKLIKNPFDKFHIDANGLTGKGYWAYSAFDDYYNLPDDIRIKVVK